MMFTEEIGLLVTLARWPAGIRRSSLRSQARLVNKATLGVENDIQVTNAAAGTVRPIVDAAASSLKPVSRLR